MVNVTLPSIHILLFKSSGLNIHYLNSWTSKSRLNCKNNSICTWIRAHINWHSKLFFLQIKITRSKNSKCLLGLWYADENLTIAGQKTVIIKRFLLQKLLQTLSNVTQVLGNHIIQKRPHLNLHNLISD